MYHKINRITIKHTSTSAARVPIVNASIIFDFITCFRTAGSTHNARNDAIAVNSSLKSSEQAKLIIEGKPPVVFK